MGSCVCRTQRGKTVLTDVNNKEAPHVRPESSPFYSSCQTGRRKAAGDADTPPSLCPRGRPRAGETHLQHTPAKDPRGVLPAGSHSSPASPTPSTPTPAPASGRPDLSTRPAPPAPPHLSQVLSPSNKCPPCTEARAAGGRPNAQRSPRSGGGAFLRPPPLSPRPTQVPRCRE